MSAALAGPSQRHFVSPDSATEMNHAWPIAVRAPCRGLAKLRPTPCIRPALWTSGSTACAITPPSACSWLSPSRRCLSSSANQSARASVRPASIRKPATPARTATKRKAAQGKPENGSKKQIHLSEAQVLAILGPGLTFDQGVGVLQEIQARRVSGSLSDKGLDFTDTPHVTEEHAARGLEWLRENYPIDEEEAAIEYAEELAIEVHRELRERAVRLRVYKELDESVEADGDAPLPVPDEAYQEIPRRLDQSLDITSQSALEARMDYVEVKNEEEKVKAEKEAAEIVARGEQLPIRYMGYGLAARKQEVIQQAELKRQANRERRARMNKEAEIKVENLLADRPAIGRLWRPTAFGLCVIILAWGLAESYEPPKSSMRMFPSIPPAYATISAIVATNLVIYILWKRPEAWKLFIRYLVLSPGDPRAFSVLGAMFSHQFFKHLWLNMLILYVAGVPVHEEIGRGAFLATYLTGGITGYLSSLYYHVLTRSFLPATIGASCAVFGIISSYFELARSRDFSLPGMSTPIQIPGWIVLGGLYVWEIRNFWRNRGIIDGADGGIDAVTHLGGLTAGIVVGYFLRARLDAESEEDQRVASLGSTVETGQGPD